MVPSPTEHVLYQEKAHRIIFLPALLTFVLAPLPLLFGRLMASQIPPLPFQQVHIPQIIWPLLLFDGMIPGLAIMAVTLAYYLPTRVVLTDRRLTYESDLLTPLAKHIHINQIDMLTFKESFLGRRFGYGTMTVYGANGTIFTLRFLRRPDYFNQLLQAMVGGAKSSSMVKA